jgi:hypothetical protein
VATAARIVFAGLVVLVAGCSARVDLGGRCGPADGGVVAETSGGSTGSGGAARGGGPGEAGATGNGGAVGASGGAPGEAGAMGSGGALSASGGAPGEAGAMGSGGALSASGGAPGEAGAVGSGGGTGGSPASGGTLGSGGAASGGAGPMGGRAGAVGLCDDNLKDGDETDVDCGGSCPPCSFRQACLVDVDCSATAPGCDQSLGGCACDAYAMICVSSHCVDRWKDSSESDVDCGGECPGCGPGRACYFDSDCSLNAAGCAQCTCDANTFTCVIDHCYDHKQNYNETDVDCGGSQCLGCALGQHCGYDTDCASRACDGVSGQCVTDPCADHRTDGTESDQDCGGSTCARCAVGKNCNVNSDCQPGHLCNALHECQ